MDLSYNMRSRSKRSEPVLQNYDAILKRLTYAFLVEDEDDKLYIESFYTAQAFLTQTKRYLLKGYLRLYPHF